MTEEQRNALLEAGRLYRRWATESADYPHDERGCIAHDAIISAITAIDGDVPVIVPYHSRDWVDGVWQDVTF